MKLNSKINIKSAGPAPAAAAATTAKSILNQWQMWNNRHNAELVNASGSAKALATACIITLNIVHIVAWEDKL